MDDNGIGIVFYFEPWIRLVLIVYTFIYLYIS